MTILVRIDEDNALEMLMDRVKYWTGDITAHELYEKMYRNLIESGYFQTEEFDVKLIVDNDYINYCDIIDELDEDFITFLNAYHNGDWEVDGRHIEAVDDDETAILVRTL